VVARPIHFIKTVTQGAFNALGGDFGTAFPSF
jgi:hypothetical protein